MEIITRTSSQLSFKCGSCGDLLFENSQAQRDHYQSEFHRYNLKRKVADLPHVCHEDFLVRQGLVMKTLAEEQSTQENNGHGKKELRSQCKYCDKNFSSEKGLKNHYASGKHPEVSLMTSLKATGAAASPICTMAAIKKSEEALRKRIWTLRQAGQEEAFFESIERLREIIADKLVPVKYQCIFCPFICTNLDRVSLTPLLRHMSLKHSFYVPDLEYLTNLPGLLAFLLEKIELFSTCIYCHRDYRNPSALKKHMLDKGHTMIGFDNGGDDEVAEFYNFELNMDKDAADYSGSECEEDLDDADFEDIDAGDDGENLEFVSEEELDDAPRVTDDGDELILPSGKRLGHRAYRVYYRQNIRESLDDPTDDTASLPSVSRKSSTEVMTFLERGRERLRERRELQAATNIIHSSSGLTSKMEVANQRIYLRKLAKNEQKMGVKGNAFQPHFREQIL